VEISWFGGASISYLTGISVALVEDMPDNMWRLVDVNTDVVIEEGFIEDEPSLPQKQDEGRTEADHPAINNPIDYRSTKGPYSPHGGVCETAPNPTCTQHH